MTFGQDKNSRNVSGWVLDVHISLFLFLISVQMILKHYPYIYLNNKSLLHLLEYLQSVDITDLAKN